jgi:hypothetical protein
MKYIFLIIVSIFLFSGCQQPSINSIKSAVKSSIAPSSKEIYEALDTPIWFDKYEKFEKKAKAFDLQYLSQYHRQRLFNYAAYSSHQPCKKMQYLINNNAKVTKKYDIKNMIFDSIENSSTKIDGFKCLVNSYPSFDLNTQDYYGNTLLHIANKKRGEAFINFLLSKKVKQNIKNKKNQIAFDLSSNKIKLVKDYIEKNKLSILTEYFMNKRLKLDKPKMPNKPKAPKKLIKGEFETTKAFNKRLKKAEEKRQKEIEKYNKLVQKISNKHNRKVKYLQDNIDKIRNIAMNKAYGIVYGKPKLKELKYNADKELFYGKVISTKKNLEYDVNFHVPLKKAKFIKKKLLKSNLKVIYKYENEKMVLQNIEIPMNKNIYTAYITDKNHINNDEIKVTNNSLKFQNENFIKPNLLTAINTSISTNVKAHTIDNKVISGNDELALLLNKAKKIKTSPNKHAIIIGIEKYDVEDSVTFSSNSAKMFEKYANISLGVPKDNIWTFTENKTTIGYLKRNWRNFLKSINKNDIVYFYYSGHGIPSKNGEAYLLPSDGDASIALNDKSMRLSNIYKVLENTQAKHIFAFIDSCFSGKQENGKMIFKGVGAITKHKRIKINKNKMTIFSAGSNDDFSNQYKEKKHRLFSYFLMKGISQGKTNTEELHKYVKSEVLKVSKKMGEVYIQIPQISGKTDISITYK